MTLKKVMNSWLKEAHVYRSKTSSLRKKYERLVSHVYIAASNGSVKWSWPQ